MAPSRENILEVCSVLAEQENLEVTIVESGKAALITGFGAFAGALLGGPIGVAIGGTLGSVTAAIYGRGKYRSLVQVIRDMSPAQKQKLAMSVQKVLKDVTIQDFQPLLFLILNDAALKQAVIHELGAFLSKELNMVLNLLLSVVSLRTVIYSIISIPKKIHGLLWKSRSSITKPKSRNLDNKWKRLPAEMLLSNLDNVNLVANSNTNTSFNNK